MVNGLIGAVKQSAIRMLPDFILRVIRRGLKCLPQAMRKSRSVFRALVNPLEVRRLGTFHSHGLVATSLLGPESVIYSVGVGEDIDFDIAMIRQVGCKIVGIDPTPRSQKFIEEHQNLPAEYTYVPFGLDATTGTQCFYFPKNASHVSMSLTEDSGTGSIECEFLSLDDLMDRLDHDYVDFIRLNIEGGEYGILEQWLEDGYQAPVGQMWVEFHPYRTDGGRDRELNICRGMAKLGWLPIHDNRYNVLFVNQAYYPTVLVTESDAPRRYGLMTGTQREKKRQDDARLPMTIGGA